MFLHFFPELAENLLPVEVWCCIFSNLRVADLKNVTLVCKHFNEIVSNSMELMADFKITLRKNFKIPDLRQILSISVRKYQVFKVAINFISAEIAGEMNQCDWSFLAETQIKNLQVTTIAHSYANLWKYVSGSLHVLSIHLLNIKYLELSIIIIVLAWKMN